MLVFLNPGACGGRASLLWHDLEPALRTACLGPSYDLVTSLDELDRALAGPPRLVVAAGGDGTVHAVVNAVMRLPEEVRRATVVGAVALGSSNDFHKPLAVAPRLRGIPILLDSERSVARDVGVLELLDRASPPRHFVLNASVGMVANGNRAYNDAGPLLRAMKRSTTAMALAVATARTLVSTPTLPVRLTFGEVVTHARITNASFLLSPFVSGSLRYDVSAPPDEDELAVALCGPMGLARRLRTLGALARGRFLGLPGTTVLRAETIGVEVDTPVAVELDGEILSTRAFRIRRLRKAVNVCT